MLERPIKETQLGDTDDLIGLRSASQVESWRRTVLPPAHSGLSHPNGAFPPPPSPLVLSTSPMAATTAVPDSTYLAVPSAGPPPASASSSSSAGGHVAAADGPYPASDPLGLFVKRPIPPLARSVAPERTLSLSSSGSAHPTVLTRTPSLSESSSYMDHHGQPAASHKGTTPASSDHCPASPIFLPLGLDLAATSLSLSSGPSPTASPTALRPEDELGHPPVSLLSALLASHSHHTKALNQPSSGLSSVHQTSCPPSAFASPGSSMPNSTASSPLGGSIHPHLAQSARQRRFSSSACDILENVGEEAEVEEVEGQQQRPDPGPPSEPPKPAKPSQQQRPQPAPKARIGIPSAKPPSIFLAASPAPSIVPPSTAGSVRKSSIMFVDDPEIAARRNTAPEPSSTTTPAVSDGTTDSSSHLQPSTPEASPAPSVRASLAAYALPPPLPPANGPPQPARRGLSFAEPPKPPLSPTSTHPHSPVPTPVKKPSGLTFAVSAVCARPKALGPEKAVGVLEEDESGSDDDDGSGADEGSGDGEEDEEDEDEEEDGDEEDDLDAVHAEEADGYEEDDEGEGSDGLDVGEREGERYRFRRESLFGQDSDEDSLSDGAGSDSDQVFDDTASIRTRTSGRGSIFSNFSGLAPFDGGEVGGEDGERQASLSHRRSSSLRNRAGWTRHSPTLPPIHAAGPSSPLALQTAADPASTPAPAPTRRRPLFSFIRGRRGNAAAPRSPHHAPRLLANGATGFSPRLTKMTEGVANPSAVPEQPQQICRDDFLPTHLKSEEGKQKEREAELRELLSSDGGGGVGRDGKCSRHRSPPPSSSGRERSQDRSQPKQGRGRKATRQKEPIPPSFAALDRTFDAANAFAAETLRPPSAIAKQFMHASDSGAQPAPSLAGRRSKARRRSYNHGSACRPKVNGKTTSPVFLSEAEAELSRHRSRPIPTPCRRMVDDNWDGDDGGFA